MVSANLPAQLGPGNNLTSGQPSVQNLEDGVSSGLGSSSDDAVAASNAYGSPQEYNPVMSKDAGEYRRPMVLNGVTGQRKADRFKEYANMGYVHTTTALDELRDYCNKHPEKWKKKLKNPNGMSHFLLSASAEEVLEEY